jgi:hypothetical protein
MDSASAPLEALEATEAIEARSLKAESSPRGNVAPAPKRHSRDSSRRLRLSQPKGPAFLREPVAR